jgi:cyclopropane fatty-acyl-phospholipid synthase-like methyltransferase
MSRPVDRPEAIAMFPPEEDRTGIMELSARAAGWEARFAESDDYLFGEAPNAFLAAEAHRIPAAAEVLAVADGEGRNGVFLAQRGLRVHAVEAAPSAIAKSRRLAAARGVSLTWEQADLLQWDWPVGRYDAVAAIFVQFVAAAERPAFFARLASALKPGGLLLLEGYGLRQLEYGTGGPREPSQLYTEALLRESFAALEILELRSYDADIAEGTRHVGRSALVDLVARRPLG